jgi:ACS family D-galactonate transporter-like MFS transporter
VLGLHTSIAKLGSVVAMWVLPPLIVTLGWRLGFTVVSSVGPLALIAVFLLMANEPKDVGIRERLGIAVTSSTRAQARSGEERVPITQVIRNRNVLLLALSQFLFFTNYYGMLNWLPTYFKTVVGTSEVEAGFQTGFILWGTIVGFAISGPAANYFGRTRPLYTGGILATALLTVLFATGSVASMPAWSWPFLMVIYGLCLSPMVFILPILTSLVPVRSLGTAGGVALTVGYMGGMVASPIMGAIVDVTGSLATSFWFAVLCPGLGALTSSLIVEGKAHIAGEESLAPAQ